MEFKKDIGWKACYDEERNLYTAATSWRGSYHLYEIDKEIYDYIDQIKQILLISKKVEHINLVERMIHISLLWTAQVG